MHGSNLAMFVLGLIVVSSALVAGKQVEYKICPKVTVMDAKVNSVDITPCPTEPCVFVRGTTVKCTVNFTPVNKTITNGTLHTYAYIAGGVKVAFPLPNPNACKDHNLSCPLKEAVAVDLMIELAIQKIFPAIELVAEFDMKDQDDNYVFCFQFNAAIKSDNNFAVEEEIPGEA